MTDPLRILNLSRSEAKTWQALQAGHSTALAIAQTTRLARQTVYNCLQSLQRRNIVCRRVQAGKQYWQPNHSNKIFAELSSCKQALTADTPSEHSYGLDNTGVTIYRGSQTIRSKILDIVTNCSDKTLTILQGDPSQIGWHTIFDQSTTHKLNRKIKDLSIITHATLGDQWYQLQSRKLGYDWLKEIEGRAASTRLIDQHYTNHGGQLFVDKHRVYLIDMPEKILIEIADSNIQKMILGLFELAQDHGKAVDVNQIIRDLAQKENA